MSRRRHTKSYIDREHHVKQGTIGPRARGFWSLGLFVSPCIMLGPLFQMVSAGEISFRFLFPTVVYAFLFIASLYSVVLKRSFFNDLAPWLVAPFGLLFRTPDIAKGALNVGKWTAKAATRNFGVDNPLEKELGVPHSLFSLKGHQRVMARLRAGRSAILGRNSKRVVFADLLEQRHIIVTGETGYGKTTVVLTMIASMLMVGPSILERWRFKIFDAKQVAGWWFKPLAEALPGNFEVKMEFAETLAALEKLYEEMQERNRQVGQAGMEPEDAGLDRILVWIDEPQTHYYATDEGKRYQFIVQELVNLGRQSGIHVILVTPYALAQVISTTYRNNLRIVTTHMKKQTIASHGIQGVHQLKRYEFLFEMEPSELEVFFKVFKVDRDDILRIIDDLVQEVQPVGYEFDPVELMIRIAASVPNCGYRTYQKEGVLRCKAMVAAGTLPSVPFPWSEIEIEDVDGKEVAKPSKSADLFIRRAVSKMKRASILSPQTEAGKAPEFIANSATDAIVIWRNYSQERI